VGSAADPRNLPEDEVKIVLAAIDDMTRKPSSEVRAARILGLSSSALNKAVASMRPSYALREKVAVYLAKKRVIREPTAAAMAEVYGPSPLDDWTWATLRAREGTPEQQAAKRWAFNPGGQPRVPLEVAVRVFTRPPWASEEFRRRPTAWWTGELVQAARHAVTLTPRKQLAELVNEDFELLKTG
jgi:hypothetical protein